MHNLTITASDGEELTGQLPAGWHEVPLGPYTALAAAVRPVPTGTGLVPTVHPFASEAGCHALAALLGLPGDGTPFLVSPSLLLPIYEAAPWLFDGPLPAGEPAATFTHEGVSYAWAGTLEHTPVSQWEALMEFLESAPGNPLSVAPALLAVLYPRQGQPHTPESVRDAAAAFTTLPLSVGWPAIVNFLQRSESLANATQLYFAARPLAAQALTALETVLTAPLPSSAPRGFYWSTGRWLIKRWLKLVRRQLRTCLRPWPTTAAAAKRPASSLLPAIAN